MMNELANLLSSTLPGTPQSHANMTIYPLHHKNGHQRGYQTLDEAITAKNVEVLEVTEGGSVPNLKVRNTGALPILLIVGEELIGAKQNRVLNTSLLVPAQSELQIPVSCVEQGRWSYQSRNFSSTTTSSHLRLRKEQTENVTISLRSSPKAYDANQSKVWGEVSRKISSHGTSSATRAMHDMYDQMETQIKDYLAAFQAPEAQGIMVAINGKVVGADLFDHAETLKILWPKLVRSYAVDALEQRSDQSAQPQSPTSANPSVEFWQAVQKATDETYDSVGMGKDVRLSSDQVSGSGLLWEDRLIHVSVFNAK